MRDVELESYFDSMKNLVQNEDFKVLISTLETQAEGINSVYQTPSDTGSNGLWYRKGQLNIIFFLMNLKENTEIGEEAYLESLELRSEVDQEDPYV